MFGKEANNQCAMTVARPLAHQQSDYALRSWKIGSKIRKSIQHKKKEAQRKEPKQNEATINKFERVK